MQQPIKFSMIRSKLGVGGQAVKYSSVIKLAGGNIQKGANGKLSFLSSNVDVISTAQNAQYLHSTYLLRPAYTGPVMRVRNPGNGREANIYTDAIGYITKIETFSNAADLTVRSTVTGSNAYINWITSNQGYVTTWYDQSTTAAHLTMTTTTLQPLYNHSSNLICFSNQYLRYSQTVTLSNATIVLDYMPTAYSTSSPNWYNNQTLVRNYVAASNAGNWGICLQSPGRFCFANGPTDALFSVNDAGVGQRSISMVTRNSTTGQVTFFSNGTKGSTFTTNTGAKSATSLLVGSNANDVCMRSLIYYNSVLSDSTISDLYKNMLSYDLLLTSSNITTTNAKINWSMTSNVAYTKITWFSPAMSNLVYVSPNLTQTSYTISGLSSNTNYSLSIAPYNTLTQIGKILTLGFNTPGALAVGGPLSLPQVSTTSLNVTWTMGSYEYVKVSAVSASSDTLVSPSLSNTTSYSLVGLSAGTSYTISVTPYDEFNMSGAALTSNITTPAVLDVGTVTSSSTYTTTTISWTKRDYAYMIITWNNGGTSPNLTSQSSYTVSIPSGSYTFTLTPYTYDGVAGTASSVSTNILYSPASISGLQNWYTADAGVTINTGTTIRNIADQSGNNRTAYASGTVNYLATGLNNKPSITFSNNGRLDCLGVNSTAFTQIYVTQVKQPGRTVQWFATASNVGWVNGAVHVNNWNNTVNVQVGGSGGGTQTTSSWVDNVPFIYELSGSTVSGSVNVKVYFNGVQQATQTGTGIPLLYFSGMNIGGWDGDLSRYLTGNISEFIHINNQLDDVSRQKLEGYVAWKWWGSNNTLPANHPYKNSAP